MKGTKMKEVKFCTTWPMTISDFRSCEFLPQKIAKNEKNKSIFFLI